MIDMMYVVKFLYNTFLLPPGIFIILLFAIGVYIFKKEKIASIIILLVSFVFYVMSTSIFAGALIRPLEHSYKLPADLTKGASAIVMLGGGATPDTPDIGGLGHLSGSSAARLLTVIKLYNRTKLPVIISGGKVFSDGGNESMIAKRQLIDLGIPAADIIAENRSRTTEENAIYTSAILKKRAVKKVFLVTSAYHMRRSVICFKQSRVATIPIPTDYTMSIQPKYYFNEFAPSPGGLVTTSVAIREYLGILALQF
jgi:uncharacterized SAM-binding protein YcdF (DUF218 family)